MSPLLDIDAVTYRHPDASAPALRDVSLAIEEGEFVVVAGPTGSGKSTLIRAACGLVPHFHGGDLTGRVVVGGMDTREHGPGDLARVTATVLQEPETQVVMTGVRSELSLGLENRGESAGRTARAVEEAALVLGIADLLERPVHELSGGELQRVALAAALAGAGEGVRLVALDEPTSQLDPVAADELIGLLRRLNEEWGVAVLLAEHRLERCLSAADRVIAMGAGAVTCDADPQRFLEWALAHEPTLATPAAQLFHAAGLHPAPTGVKSARRALSRHAPATDLHRDSIAASDPLVVDRARPALELKRVWHSYGAMTSLRDVSLRVCAGEKVALMGRNGAGKSTALKIAHGLLEPGRGKVVRAGRVALLLQSPGDYLVHERVRDELDAGALERAGLAHLADRDPRDLSGGERQLLALEVVMSGGEPPVALCLDEPTRGMDRAHKAALADRLDTLAAGGTAIVVATHDVELAAAAADRVVLMGRTQVVADGPTEELLAGGWYFATETARILDGAALLPSDGARLLSASVAEPAEIAP